MNGEENDGLENSWPFVDIEKSTADVREALKSLGGSGTLAQVTKALGRDDENLVLSALEMACDRSRVDLDEETAKWGLAW